MKYALSLRYAKVLFDLDSNFALHLKIFVSTLELLKTNPKLQHFFNSPQITIEEKKNVLDLLTENLDPLFVIFFSYLIQKKRLDLLNSIKSAYQLLVNEHFQRWEVDLVTKIHIDSDIETKLVNNLESIFQKKIILNKKIDPKLIGGAILVISNKMLDWSIKGRLKKLKENLLAI